MQNAFRKVQTNRNRKKELATLSGAHRRKPMYTILRKQALYVYLQSDDLFFWRKTGRLEHMRP
jgi:hypothetical protein